MTKEEMMALKLRQMLPYLQMHEAAKGNHLGPVRGVPDLTPEQADEMQREKKLQEIQLLRKNM